MTLLEDPCALNASVQGSCVVVNSMPLAVRSFSFCFCSCPMNNLGTLPSAMVQVAGLLISQHEESSCRGGIRCRGCCEACEAAGMLSLPVGKEWWLVTTL